MASQGRARWPQATSGMQKLDPREEVAETQEANLRLSKPCRSKLKESPPACVCVCVFNAIERKYNENVLPDFPLTVEEKGDV